MKKYNLKNKKIYILISLIIGSLSIFLTGYSSYVIFGVTKISTEIDPMEIKIEVDDQKLIKYEDTINKIKTKDNIIVSDDYSLMFSFDNYAYQTAQNGSMQNKKYERLYLNMGINILIEFSNQNLFSFIRDNVKSSFIDFTYSEKSDGKILKIENNDIVYKANNIECYKYEQNKINFNLAINEKDSNSYFYLYNLAKINDLEDLNGKFNFYINFRFDFIDDYYGYCLNNSFDTIDKFGIVKIEIKCVNYLV